MDNIEFRLLDPLNKTLLNEVENLAKEIWTEHYSPIIGLDQVNYMLQKFQSTEAMINQINEGYNYQTITVENELAGYFSVQPRIQSLFLSKAYVHIDFRGRGIFSHILNEVKRIAGIHNLHRIELTVNKYNSNTVNIYKSKGFNILSDEVFDIGNGYVMDDYVMQLEI